jgi:arginyl-tRNA synthetase
LRTSRFGDDKDRVLVKSDGSYTYFLPDLAYHRDKAGAASTTRSTSGAPTTTATCRACRRRCGARLPDFLDVEIVQMVRIIRGGREVKLSKRAASS